MLHKTIYEINSTLLLRTHFKPPSSVCNNFLLPSHVEFGRLLLNMLFIAFYIAAKMSISDVSYIFISRKSHRNHILVNRVFIIFIIYSGCCHVILFLVLCKALYALAKTRCLWCLQAPLRSEVARCVHPSMIHIVKGSILIFICLYTLWAAAVDYKSSPKTATLGSVICVKKILTR